LAAGGGEEVTVGAAAASDGSRGTSQSSLDKCKGLRFYSSMEGRANTKLIKALLKRRQA
jgi:hypothetical protein